MSSVAPKTALNAQGNSSKHLVLTCLLMASEANHVTAPSPLEISREIAGSEELRLKSQHSPVFSPLYTASDSDEPTGFDLCEEAASVANETPTTSESSIAAIELHSPPDLPVPPEALLLLADVEDALRRGGRFEKAQDGDGVWLLRSADGDEIAVFKDEHDEEGDRSKMSVAIQRGCQKGQRARREYLAYLLDSALPAQLRAGVPATCLVQVYHRSMGMLHKFGSVQRYITGMGSSEDFGASKFDLMNVQRIAIFDLLTLNLDRHGGNMLVDEYGTLIPIDHGYSLPEEIAGEPWLDWRLWPQAGLVDEELRLHVQQLNPLFAKNSVSALGLSDGVWHNVARRTVQLQQALSAGDSLRDVAESLMQSPALHTCQELRVGA